MPMEEREELSVQVYGETKMFLDSLHFFQNQKHYLDIFFRLVSKSTTYNMWMSSKWNSQLFHHCRGRLANDRLSLLPPQIENLEKWCTIDTRQPTLQHGAAKGRCGPETGSKPGPRRTAQVGKGRGRGSRAAKSGMALAQARERRRYWGRCLGCFSDRWIDIISHLKKRKCHCNLFTKQSHGCGGNRPPTF